LPLLPRSPVCLWLWWSCECAWNVTPGRHFLLFSQSDCHVPYLSCEFLRPDTWIIISLDSQNK
jgi:hypothetical protein